MLVRLQFHWQYWVLQLLNTLLRQLRRPPSSVHLLQAMVLEIDGCHLFVLVLRCRFRRFGFLRSPTPSE